LLDLLTVNALVAAESVFISVQCEVFALEGISQLLDTVGRISEGFGYKLAIEGLLLTMSRELFHVEHSSLLLNLRST
jgi:chromosome partitioning protein